MKKLLAFLGYTQNLKPQIKFTYIINAFSIGIVLLFLFFYLFFVHSTLVNLVTGLCLFFLLSTFIFLKFKKITAAKLILISGFLFQECSLVFFWFPKETNLNLFYFIVAPITFFIFDFQKPRERILIVIINVIANGLLILSELRSVYTPMIPLNNFLIDLFSTLSVVSTISSIFIVYFFYAATLNQNQKDLLRLANTDSLTSVFNRRTLFKEGKIILRQSLRNLQDYSLIIMDIDHFKDVNDAYGHPAGDEVLIQMTDLLKKNIRKGDILARYGGEEFAIIVNSASNETIKKIGENLRSRVEEYPFAVSPEKTIHLTISIGICSFTDEHEEFEQVVRDADQALYKAKRMGRNNVQLSH